MNSGHIGALRPDHSDETEPQTARPPYWAGLSRGLWVFARPEAKLGQPPEGQLQHPWPCRAVCPSRSLWTSAPRIVREYAAAGSRAGEIASSMPALE